MKILYIDHGSKVSDEYMYQYYGDLYRELKKKCEVILVEKGVKDFTNVDNLDIDCIIFGLGYFTQTSPQMYKKIQGLSESKVPVVCLLHKPQTLISEKLNFCKVNNIDILMDTNITYKEFGKKVNAESLRFWFTANPKVYYPRKTEKIYDIGFSGADHGGDKLKGPTKDIRNRIHSVLKNTKYELFWNSTRDLSYRINSVEEYATKINQSKIWVATTGPVNDISPRYFEVMLSKTLLLCNEMPYEYEGVFQDGVNCVIFKNDLSDLEEKVDYYINNDKERSVIVENAFNMTIQNYTWERIADKLLDKIKQIKK